MGILFLPLVEIPFGFFGLLTVTPISSHFDKAKLNRTAILYSNAYLEQDNAISQTLRLFS